MKGETTMEITLEKIELVKDRTGVSYKEAKEALEFANGNVVDAIIYVEENIDREFSSKEKKAVNKVVDNVKELVRKGNVTKIRVYHGDDVVLNLPVIFGVAGTVLFPWGAVASAVAAAFTKCRVELVKEDGSVVNVSEKTGAVFETVKEKGGVVVDEVIDKGSDLYAAAKVKCTEIYNVAKEKVPAFYEVAKDMGSDLYEAAKDKGTELYNAAKDKKDDIADRIGKKTGGIDAGAEEPSMGGIAEEADNTDVTE